MRSLTRLSILKLEEKELKDLEQKRLNSKRKTFKLDRAQTVFDLYSTVDELEEPELGKVQ